MPSLQDELINSLSSYETGRELEISRNEKGEAVIGPSQEAVMRITKLRAPMRQAEPQTFAETKKDMPTAVGGLASGAIAGTFGLPGDVVGILKGAYDAANPEAGEGRFEAFMSGLEEVSNVAGSEAIKNVIRGVAKDLPEEQKATLEDAMLAGEFVGVGSAIKKAPKAVSALGDAVEGAGDAAKARMADADGSVTLTSGVDPDPAIAAAGDAVKAMRGGVEAPELNASLKPPTETEPGIIAFHGSGKDFDEFKVEYIGTGEGAQAYGYGLYFTDSKNIAKFYKNSVSGNNVTAQTLIFDEVSKVLKGKMKLTYDIVMDIVSKKTPLSSLPKDTQSPIKQILQKNYEEELKKGKDTIYRVALEPKPEDMIDYQTTFADQPKKIQDALKAVGYEVETNKVGMKVSPSEIRDAMRMPMSVIINKLKKEIGEKELSQKLLEQGIPGIKYRAAGSRGANVDAADVEMNYVIFDDKMIKILEKYGIVGPVAITGVAATQQEGNSDGTGA